MSLMSQNNSFGVIFGESLLLATILVSVGSVEMSSRFSVKNFAKDQETLQSACDALSSFIVIGVIFAIGATLTLYNTFGTKGGLICGAVCLFVMLWIVISYMHAFKHAAEKYNLKSPKLFQRLW